MRSVKDLKRKGGFTSLQNQQGESFTNTTQMLEVASCLYINLFKVMETDPVTERSFLENLTSWVPEDALGSLESPVALLELSDVLSNMNWRRVPGLDASPVVFYSTFWDDLGLAFLHAVKEVLGRGMLTKSMRTGGLSLLYKKGNKANLANWKLLTMLCADAKIIAKVLTERPKKVIADLVHRDQTCGVPGHSVFWNCTCVLYVKPLVAAICAHLGIDGLLLLGVAVLGVNFLLAGATRANWEECLPKARWKMALWRTRSLSLIGKMLALKVDILPTLLYLEQVYPLPCTMRKGRTKDAFNFVWWGKYEYVRREVCNHLAAPIERCHQYFVRLWLPLLMRQLVKSRSNIGLNAETQPTHYSHAVRWSKTTAGR
ncbi:hypothetical protein Z043_122569, partial [Scleropages formosus]